MESRTSRSSFSRIAAIAAVGTILTAGCGRGEAPETGSSCFAISAQVEQWRCLVEKYFKPQHVTWALNIIQCESGGDPNARNSSSGASGLFQHMPQYWADRASKAGFPGASVFDPEANVAASAWLLYAPGGGPGHWSCKHSPFEQSGYQDQCNGGGTTPAPTPTEPACSALPAAGGIVDDASSCFELHGPAEYWRAVTGSGHAGGFVWTDAYQQSTASNWARWNLVLGAAGRYTVKYYAVSGYAIFSSTRYEIRHGGSTESLRVDQSAGGTGWRTLGTFDFASGGDQHVSVFDDTPSPVADGQHIIADAIKLEPADAPEPVPSPAPSPAPSTPPATSEPPDAQGAAQPDPGAPLEPTQGGLLNNTREPGGRVYGGCALAASDHDAGAVPAVVVALALLLAARRRRSGAARARAAVAARPAR